MSDNSRTPGPAYECAMCETVTPVKEREVLNECPDCGEYAMVKIVLSECPSPDTCNDEAHHYGTGLHHTEKS